MKEISSVDAKKIMVDVLVAFRDFCETRHLRYYLAYGTLLGAVRHKGFIPWDDDVDVMMPRRDYMELISTWNSANRKLKLVSMYSSDKYLAPLTKIVDTDTILVQNYGLKDETELGIYIDVFCMDGLPSDEVECSKFLARGRKIKKQWYYSVVQLPPLSKNFFHDLLRVARVMPYKLKGYRYYLDKTEKHAQTYDYEVSQYVGVISYGSGAYERIEKIHIEPGMYFEFEGYWFRGPSGYKVYLGNHYGDYMKLPPIEKQVSHHKYKAWWRDGKE